MSPNRLCIEVPLKSGLRKLQSLQTAPLRTFTPGLVGVVSHQQKSTQEPRLHHKLSIYFLLEKAQFPRVTTQNS
jgi:hypothetical protein